MYRKRRTNSYEIPFQYDCVNVKFLQNRNDNPVLVIEIIELLRLLYLCYDDPDPNTFARLSIHDICAYYRSSKRDVISIDGTTF